MNSPILRQTWIASGVLVNFFAHGMMLSYISCLLPALRAADSPIKIDLDSAKWLGSIDTLLAAPYYITACILMERFGRKRVYKMTFITDVSSWILIYWATDIKTLMFARMLGGVAVGFSYALGAVSLAEYTSPKYRGFFLNMKALNYSLGCTTMHVLSHYFDWKTVALICTVPCFISLVNSLFWVESPSWLLSKNRFDEFEKTFYWLRGQNEEATKELDSMMGAQKARQSQASRYITFREKTYIFLKKFKQRNFLKPLSISLFTVMLRESVGKQFFSGFAFDIMDQVTNDKSYNFLCIIIFDVAICTSTLISCVLIKLMGRKTLVLLSGIPASVTVFMMSVILYSVSTGSLNIKQTWVLPLLMTLFMTTANLGCTTVPYVISSEIFPLPHRETGMAIGGCTMGLLLFLHMHLTPQILLHLRLYGTFALMGVLMTVALTFLYFIMPETKDRTLQEIEDYFEHGRFPNDVKRPNDDAERMIQPVTTSTYHN